MTTGAQIGRPVFYGLGMGLETYSFSTPIGYFISLRSLSISIELRVP